MQFIPQHTLHTPVLDKKVVPVLNFTYDPKEKKPTKWSIRIFAVAENDAGYVHSIIPNYGKLTGDMCYLPYLLRNSSFQE
jgi:hypothetical protein